MSRQAIDSIYGRHTGVFVMFRNTLWRMNIKGIGLKPGEVDTYINKYKKDVWDLEKILE